MAESIGNAVGAAGGVMKYFEGRKMQKQAQSAINNFEWQELNNPYKDLQVSTLGSELRQEQANITTAGNVEALRSGGTRALVGGLGRVQAQNNMVSREIAANLDEQQKTIDYAGAQDDVRKRDMIENRQANELAGYGQMMNVGMGMKYAGIGNIQGALQAEGENQDAKKEMALGMMTGGLAG